MKILVSAKRVEDPDAQIELLPSGLDIDRSDLDFKLNPFCEIAVEAALRLVEEQGGEVVAVCIGEDEAEKELRTALAMGAGRAIFIEADERELDADLCARIWAELVAEEEPDLVLLGKQSTDGDGQQMGQMLAALLDWPQATRASRIDCFDDHLRVCREIDHGLETLEIPLPAVVTADLRLNEPRYPTLPNIMKAKRKPIDRRSLDDFDLDLVTRTEVKGFLLPPSRKGGVLVHSTEELLERLLADHLL